MNILGKHLNNNPHILYKFPLGKWRATFCAGICFPSWVLRFCLILIPFIFSYQVSFAQVTSAGTIGTNQSSCINGTFDPANLTNVSSATGTSLNYQWAFSTVNNTYNTTQWTNISGAIGTTYDPPAISQTTYYTRLVRSGLGAWSASNVVTVTITSPNFYVTANNNSPSCGGGAMNLTAVSTSYGANLTTNGDFSGGNNDFSSDFGNTSSGDTTIGNCDKRRVASLPLTNWSSCPDVGHGNVLLLNNEDKANKRAWYQDVPMVSGTTYRFEIEVASISWQNFAQLYLIADGVTINTVQTLPSPCNWVTISGTFTATSTGNKRIEVVNQNANCTGNDYMLDNIKFRALTTGPTSTWGWTGPSSYSSSSQNPTIASATAANAGTYTVSLTSSGCTAQATTTTSLKATPSVTASNTGSYCVGNTISLTASTIDPNSSTGTWNWTGPNGYTSSTRNPTLP